LCNHHHSYRIFSSYQKEILGLAWWYTLVILALRILRKGIVRLRAVRLCLEELRGGRGERRGGGGKETGTGKGRRSPVPIGHHPPITPSSHP
jgi:hypothetical protein